MTDTHITPSCVVVTGATGAIGTAIVDALYQRGIDTVVAACRRPEAIDEIRRILAARYPESPTDLRAARLDLATRSLARAGARELLAAGLVPDAVLNNAGTMPLRHPERSSEGIDLATQVNLLSTLAFAEELLPAMQTGSVMVFTSSVARHIPTAGSDYLERAARASGLWGLFYNYSRSKLLLTRAARLLADREHPRGIRVNCADPGIVDTTLLCTGYRVLDAVVDTLGRPLMNLPSRGAMAALRAMDTPLTAIMATPGGVSSMTPLTSVQASVAAQTLSDASR